MLNIFAIFSFFQYGIVQSSSRQGEVLRPVWVSKAVLLDKLSSGSLGQLSRWLDRLYSLLCNRKFVEETTFAVFNEKRNDLKKNARGKLDSPLLSGSFLGLRWLGSMDLIVIHQLGRHFCTGIF